MTAVAERPVRCEVCIEPTPAAWRYLGEAFDAEWVCEAHAWHFRAQIDSDPSNWERITEETR